MLKNNIECVSSKNTNKSDINIGPSLFINHGGGPYPVMGEENNKEMAEFMKNVPNLFDMKKLKAIIVVTAHWETDIVTISCGERPKLMYDYNNFPPECYEYEYNAPGDAILARRIHNAFGNNNIPSRLDDKRCWDHGVFIPMMLINPKADIPIVQISILKDQNPSKHYEIGNVLHHFRGEGVAVFGSGMSYHNEEGFNRANTFNDGIIENEKFDSYLTEICTSLPEKRKCIVDWEDQPGALDSHRLGEADHLMPLIVCAGAGGLETRGRKVFESVYKRKFKLSGFIWDD